MPICSELPTSNLSQEALAGRGAPRISELGMVQTWCLCKLLSLCARAQRDKGLHMHPCWATPGTGPQSPLEIASLQTSTVPLDRPFFLRDKGLHMHRFWATPGTSLGARPKSHHCKHRCCSPLFFRGGCGQQATRNLVHEFKKHRNFMFGPWSRSP